MLEAAPDLPLIAGGKSFGGRMTTQAQAEAPLPGIRGIGLLGFPLHPAAAPSVKRALTSEARDRFERAAQLDAPRPARNEWEVLDASSRS